MKKQTFIICLEDRDGLVINFERWTYKKAETCIANMLKLYRGYYGLYKHDLLRADKVVCYPTPDGYTKKAPVWSVSKDKFLSMILKEDAA